MWDGRIRSQRSTNNHLEPAEDLLERRRKQLAVCLVSMVQHAAWTPSCITACPISRRPIEQHVLAARTVPQAECASECQTTSAHASPRLSSVARWKPVPGSTQRALSLHRSLADTLVSRARSHDSCHPLYVEIFRRHSSLHSGQQGCRRADKSEETYTWRRPG